MAVNPPRMSVPRTQSLSGSSPVPTAGKESFETVDFPSPLPPVRSRETFRMRPYGKIVPERYFTSRLIAPALPGQRTVNHAKGHTSEPVIAQQRLDGRKFLNEARLERYLSMPGGR